MRRSSCCNWSMPLQYLEISDGTELQSLEIDFTAVTRQRKESIRSNHHNSFNSIPTFSSSIEVPINLSPLAQMQRLQPPSCHLLIVTCNRNALRATSLSRPAVS